MTGNQTPPASLKASFKQYCRQEAETAKLAKGFADSLEYLISQNPQAHLNISLEGDLGGTRQEPHLHIM
jgi:tRNA threonylcarbamoyladenosine biosynthesis protein TsaE